MQAEAMSKYDKYHGQSKIGFLALSKKSQQKILNSYFKNETCGEKMDELLEKLRRHRVLQQ